MPNGNATVLRLLRSPLSRFTKGTTIELRYLAPKSGKQVELPVWAARDGDRWLVGVGMPDRKKWFRAFTQPTDATITVKGRSYDVTGHLAGADEIEAARAAYLRGVPTARRVMKGTEPIVVFEPR